MADPQFNPAEARKLFEIIATQIHIVAIHPNGLQVTGKWCGDDIDMAIEAAAKSNGNGNNVYWTVNAVRDGLNTKPKKSDIIAARFAHVDIDPPKSGGAFDKQAIAAAIMDIQAPPSFVIDSGGGLQAFWRLDDPCANLDAIEDINRQLRDYFEADACWNIDRLMRIPGSVNWPDARKRARGRAPSLARFVSEDDGVVYDPMTLAGAFPAALPVEGPSSTAVAAYVPPEGLAMVTADGLGLPATSALRMAIDFPPGTDRSGDGVACAGDLARAGYDDATIIGVLVNPANAVAAHYVAQRNPLRAAARAVELVRKDIPPPVAVSDQPFIDTEQFIANVKARTERQNGGAIPVEDDHEPQWHVPAGLPAWQRDLGSGGLAQFVECVTRSATSPQPYVTLGAALAAFGTAAGRRYASPTDLRTNVYCIGIADSGGGKDHPLRAASTILIEAGYAQYVGGGSIASGQAMITDLVNNPSMLYPLDEIGFLLSGASDRKRSAKHITDIVDKLTEFYSMASHTFLGTSYANQDEKGGGKPRKIIEQPNLSLFGVTTPSVFWGSLKSDNVMDGSLARMLIFESECNYPETQFDASRKGFPAMLMNRVKSVALGAKDHSAFPLGENAVTKPKPFPVQYACIRAANKVREMASYQREMLRAHEGTHVNSVIARMNENAIKLALIKAVSDNPESPAITKADLEWGLLISETSVNALKRAINDRVADNEIEARNKKLFRIIADSGSAGIDHTDLFRRAQFMGGRRPLNDALEFLIESNKIRVQEMPRPDGKGRKRRIYFDVD